MLPTSQLCRPGLPRKLACQDSDHETEDFVRVREGEYSSHFVNEDLLTRIMWISDQLQPEIYRECCRSNEGL